MQNLFTKICCVSWKTIIFQLLSCLYLYDSDIPASDVLSVKFNLVCKTRQAHFYIYRCVFYNPTKDSKFISYLDANNLYGWAMSKQLPTYGFKWMTDDELDDWKHLSCILEVDLEYPETNYTIFTIIIP